MSPKEAAKIIGCTPSYVGQLCRSGKIKAVKREGSYNQLNFCYDIPLEEAIRIRDSPQTVGYPRGKPRK